MKVGIVTSLANKLLAYRSELVSAILERNHTLTVLGCESEGECQAALNAQSIPYVRLPFTRRNINPLTEIFFIFRTVKILKALHIDVLLVYGIRMAPGISIAARISGIRRIYAVINGTGTLFHMRGLKGSLARFISYPLLITGLRLCSCVFFQNEDNRRQLIRLGIVARKKTCIMNGSGVNLNKFVPAPLPEQHMFLFVGRLHRDKGICEFLSAAEKVKKSYPDARFVLIGAYDENASALREEWVQPYVSQGFVEHIAWSDKISDSLVSCYAFVLPSYHEGTPRTVLEAMATGRPVITTDVPGCRETVTEGMNGFLVPAGDIDTLAERMIWLMKNRSAAERMGRESLRTCREKYDVRKVNQAILDKMNL